MCRIGGPMDMIFGVFLETYVRLLKGITSQFFSKCSKSYDNLNVKSSLKLNVQTKIKCKKIPCYCATQLAGGLLLKKLKYLKLC